MNRTMLLAAGLLALALSGCLGGDDADPPEETALTAADCEAQGLELGTDETGGPACVEPAPPASVDVSGLPDSVQAFTVVNFTWTLHTDAEEAHASRTEVRFGTESVADDQLGKPDEYGESADMREHQTFVDGQSYDGTWSTEKPGTYHFRAYAVVESTHIWGPEHVLTVTEVQPTGTSHDVAVTACGVPGVGGLEPADLSISLGDAVAWSTDDPDTYTITSTGGPVEFGTSTGGDPVTFLVPGSYTYEAVGTLDAACTGSIAVTA